MSGLGIALTALVMAVGIAGTVLPFVPGILLVWAAGLVYGLIAGFGAVGAVAFTLMTGAMIGGKIAGWVLPARRGKASGAPRSSLLFAVVGAIVGMIVIPIVGLPVGAVAGIFLAERLRLGSGSAAWMTTRAVIVGFGIGVLIEMTAAVFMAAVWIVWVLAG